MRIAGLMVGKYVLGQTHVLYKNAKEFRIAPSTKQCMPADDKRKWIDRKSERRSLHKKAPPVRFIQ